MALFKIATSTAGISPPGPTFSTTFHVLAIPLNCTWVPPGMLGVMSVLMSTSTTTAGLSKSTPSLPQTRNSLSSSSVFVFKLLVFAILPIPMVNTPCPRVAPSKALFTLRDCFCNKSESSSRPIPAIS